MNRRLAVLVTADMLPSITPELLKAYENSGIEVRGVDVTAERPQVRLCRESPHLFTGKPQAQWKQERNPIGRSRRR